MGSNPTPRTRDAPADFMRFVVWLLSLGYAKSTVESKVKLLRLLVRRGANLWDVESVKRVVALQPWCDGRKANAVDAYRSWLRMHGFSVEGLPRYVKKQKLPWIPLEREIDQLIAGCSHKVATFLQLLKETGMRCGEAWQLCWSDIDFETSTVRVTSEKHGHPRIFRLSSNLIGMLNKLPRKNEKVFGTGKLKDFRGMFCRQRGKVAEKLRNPRITRISFHTLRHWKATMEYRKTKDILHVMQLLGHKNIKNTLIYIQLEEALFKKRETEYICKVASTVKEAKQLVEAGFEYVTEIDGKKLFRKPK